MNDLIKKPQDKEIELARHYFKYNHALVNRLFMGIPKSFLIPNANGKLISIDKPNYCKGIVDLMSRVNDEQKALVYPYLVDLIAQKITEEIEYKQIPQEVFESGAICFGMCDKISYWGSYYLDMCDFRAHCLGLDRIAWRKVSVGFYVNQIQEIIEAQKNLRITTGNMTNMTSINPNKILNWPTDIPKHSLVYDRMAYPFAITSAAAVYEDSIAYWDLDFVSLKKDYQDPNSIVNQYASRPVQIATVKAQKALAKQFYARDIAVMGVYDGGDDDTEIIMMSTQAGELPTIPNEKIDFVDEQLARLGAVTND